MFCNYLVRPACLDDLDSIERLAHLAQFGMTSLPRDRDALRLKLARSEWAFRHSIRCPDGEIYFFVLVYLPSNEVVGTCKIVSKSGVDSPIISFNIEQTTRTSSHSASTVHTTLLNPKIYRSGPTEIGGLFVAPAHREKGLGRLISLSRFIFLAMHPERFMPAVMAEMRGVILSNGHSPFWDGLGRHLFKMPFKDADFLAAKDKSFILELLPHYPIYLDLLPKAAQAVVGNSHVDTMPALRLLQDEGFQMTDLIDVMDAGPKVVADVTSIRTVREARYAPVGEILDQLDVVEPDRSTPLFLISNGKLESFRSCVGVLGESGDTIKISSHVAMALNVQAGDMVWFSPLYPHSFLRRFEQWYSRVPISLVDAGLKEKARYFDH